MSQQNHQSTSINRVCEYIQQNLDQEIHITDIITISNFSKFHFHRIFSSFTGQSVAQYIQSSRLKKASYQLAFNKHESIITIALSSGFESHEAFSRAFKRHFSQTPSQFRRKPDWVSWHCHFNAISQPKPSGDQNMKVEIIQFPKLKVAVLEHLGSPDRVMETAAAFIAWRKESGLSPVNSSRTFGIPNGDPKRMEPQDFRWEVCGSILEDVPENKYGVQKGFIPAGLCAKVRHLGSYDALEQSIYPIYQEWIPTQDLELRDYPCFFEYHNFIHEVNEADLITDIYIPLQEKAKYI